MTEPDDLTPRCSTSTAARYLGVSTRRVLQMIHGGELQAWDMAAPSASRPSWVVEVRSIRKLLVAREKKIRTERSADAESLAPPSAQG